MPMKPMLNQQCMMPNIFRFLIENKVFKSKQEAIRYYFYDGQNSAKQLMAFLSTYFKKEFSETTMLEFAPGYGCVTRHLIDNFAVERLFCSDIHPEANSFLSQTFGVRTISSTVKPENFPLKYIFDVVFALSFFSHMPPHTWGDWLEKLFSLVNIEGLIIFTTHGLHSSQYFGNPMIPDDGIWF